MPCAVLVLTSKNSGHATSVTGRPCSFRAHTAHYGRAPSLFPPLPIPCHSPNVQSLASALGPAHSCPWRGPLLLPHAPRASPTCCRSPLLSTQPGRYDRSEITLMGAHHQPGARRLGDSRPSEPTCFHGEQALRNTCTPDGLSTYLSPTRQVSSRDRNGDAYSPVPGKS